MINTESKFETQKFDKKENDLFHWFWIMLSLSQAALGLHDQWLLDKLELVNRMVICSERTRGQQAVIRFLVFLKVCTCAVFFMLKDFIENEYSVLISWKSLNKIKYLQCTWSNFKSNEKQTALSNRPFLNSFYSSYNFCLKIFVYF